MYQLNDDDQYQTFMPPFDTEPMSDWEKAFISLCDKLGVDYDDFATRKEQAEVEGMILTGMTRPEIIERLNIPEELFDFLYDDLPEKLPLMIHSEIIRTTVAHAMIGDKNARHDYYLYIEPYLKRSSILGGSTAQEAPISNLSQKEIVKLAKKMKIPLPKFKEHTK